jgi:hypothetical protein
MIIHGTDGLLITPLMEPLVVHFKKKRCQVTSRHRIEVKCLFGEHCHSRPRIAQQYFK